MPVLFACGDGVGQDAAHWIFTIVGDNAITQIHHPATFCYYVSSFSGIFADAVFRFCCFGEHFSMFLGVASRQVQQIGVGREGLIELIGLWQCAGK